MRRKKKNNRNRIIKILIMLILALIIATVEYLEIDVSEEINKVLARAGMTIDISENNIATNIDINDIPKFSGKPYIEINNNKPYFTEKDYTRKAFERYSDLDNLGRCGVAYANICIEIMPTGKRESINNVKPSGWNNKSYPGLVEGDYLYNRCHLIGYQLAGENANPKNLITGTRYLNISGMLPFEDLVDNYIENNERNHVLYRVTPIYEGKNLLASGVEMEGYSVEDNGKGVCFNIYAYNVQPGININYATGDSYKVTTKR